jgi:tRNA dimethylallyltransferase
MKQIAIIGPTASGKSDLAIEVALKTNSYILSIDSLSIYKEVDIVSAKPSKEDLSKVRHFGIDELFLDEYFSVEVFIKLYKEVASLCKKEGKNLVIVGGTSFYLKTLLSGLSPTPKISKEIYKEVKKELNDLKKVYTFLYEKDKEYMKNISKNDKYRIEKALLIYKASGEVPSLWFSKNPPKPIIKDIDIYEIAVKREVLRKRIEARTKKMYETGLIDEVCFLERKYTRSPNPMKSIGIVEVLDYLDGKISKDEMLELISTHTAQLAKRQQTFNKSQFSNITSLPLEELKRLF